MLKKILNRYKLGKFITENFKDMEDFEVLNKDKQQIILKGHYKKMENMGTIHTLGYIHGKKGKKVFTEMRILGEDRE